MPSLVRVLALAAFCVPLHAADLDKLVPADAGAAVFLNVKSLTDSALFKKVVGGQVKEALTHAPIAKFCQAADFDPFRDLTSITVTAPLRLPVNDVPVCVLVKGKFHARFQIAFLAAGKSAGDEVQISTRGQRTYFAVSLYGQKLVATFVGYDTIALANSVEYLDDVVTGKMVAAPVEATKLRAAFANLDGRRTLLVGLGVSDELKQQLAKNQATKPYADKVESSTFTVHITDSIDLALGINTTDADTAKTLAQLVKQALPLLNLLAAQNEQAKTPVEYVVKNLEITSEGKTVSIRLRDITEAELLRRVPGASELWARGSAATNRAISDHLTDALIALRAERYADADRAMDGISWHDPHDARARALLDDAARSLSAAERSWAGARLCRIHLAAARKAVQRRRFGEAEDALHAARASDPRNPEVHAGFQELADRREAAITAHVAAGRAALEAGDWDGVQRRLVGMNALGLRGRAVTDLQTAFVARLVSDLRSPHRVVRHVAIVELGTLGRAAEKEAVPALLRALIDADPITEAAVRRALDKIVP